MSATLDEQNTREYYRQRRNKDAYYHYRSLCKSKNKRHGEEKDRMIQLRADITTDDDYGAIHVDGGGDENEDLSEDEENNIVDKVPL